MKPFKESVVVCTTPFVPNQELVAKALEMDTRELTQYVEHSMARTVVVCPECRKSTKSYCEQCDNTRKIELKPCPFCGSGFIDILIQPNGHWIRCAMSCGAMIREISMSNGSEIQAIVSWNIRRAPGA